MDMIVLSLTLERSCPMIGDMIAVVRALVVKIKEKAELEISSCLVTGSINKDETLLTRLNSTPIIKKLEIKTRYL